MSRYGWVRDSPDPRDFHGSLTAEERTATLPASVSLRSAMPPVYDQGQLGSCHDAETEVLTEGGWKLFSDLDEYDRLASVDPKDGALLYEFPTRIVRLPYSGEMVCGQHSNLDFRVTPDHTMLVRRWNERKRTLDEEFEFVAAKDIGWYAGLLNRVMWSGGEEASDTYVLPGVAHKHRPQRDDHELSMGTWLRFLGIYLAEGTMLKRDQRKGCISYKIQIAASKTREKNFVRDLLQQMGITALELSDRFTFSNKRLYEALASLGLEGVKAPNKFVPDFVFQQAAKMIEEFLYGHFQGDGCEAANRAHYTSSVRLADDLQRLIFLSGQESLISVRQPRVAMMGDGRKVRGQYPEHRVSVRERANKSIDKQTDLTTEWYEGEVFCAEVPTHHTLVTRRNGNILISGNCTANAIAGALEYQEHVQGEATGTPSRLFIYYNERVMEGSVGYDAGAMIRDGIKSIAKQGAPDETLWPYDINKFANRPPASVYSAAVAHEALSYAHPIRTSFYLRSVLAAKRPFVFGFTVYESFESDETASTGIVPMPDPSREEILGGHAVLAMGYKTIGGHLYIEVRNSWGGSWGDSGYCWFPVSILLDTSMSDDMWDLKVVT